MLYCIHFSIKYIIPSKHFNVGSTLFLGWYDVATSHNVKSTLKQRCVRQRRNLQCWQCWNNVVFFNVELNNVRQRRNNVVIFNADFHNVGQRRSNVTNTTIWKKDKPRFKNKIIFLNWKNLLDSKWLDWTPDEIIRENLWEFQYAFKYVHQILIIVNED